MDFCLLDQDIFPNPGGRQQAVADILADLSAAFPKDFRRLDRGVVASESHNAHVPIVCRVCYNAT